MREIFPGKALSIAISSFLEIKGSRLRTMSQPRPLVILANADQYCQAAKRAGRHKTVNILCKNPKSRAISRQAVVSACAATGSG